MTKETEALQAQILSLQARLKHERENVDRLLTKLAATEYELNHVKSILSKALEK